MTDPPTTPDAVREQFAKVQHELEVLRGMVLPMARSVEQAAPAHDGEIRDGRVWVDGRGLYLNPRSQRLLAFVLSEGRGKTWEDVCTAMGWKPSRGTVDCRVRELNRLAKEETKSGDRWPHTYFDGTLQWKLERKNSDAKGTA